MRVVRYVDFPFLHPNIHDRNICEHWTTTTRNKQVLCRVVDVVFVGLVVGHHVWIWSRVSRFEEVVEVLLSQYW